MTTSEAKPSPDPSGEIETGNARAFRRLLIDDGVVRDPQARLTPLAGGVSSDIYRVDDGEHTFVVKRALEKLKVKADWRADISRNRYEVDYLRVVSRLVPDAVPRVLEARPEHGYFTMEYLTGSLRNWKRELLSGTCRVASAKRAGEVLGSIHRHTWCDRSIRNRFETTGNFHQLRTDPYLLTVGRRQPSIAAIVAAEARRVESTRVALVHGDFSPKNLLVDKDRLVVLDCEVAWFGDPSFDIAFLLNHLVLKALHLPDHREDMLQLARAAWDAYCTALGPDRAGQVEVPIPILLPLLMIARIDGKSPVEYLGLEQQEVVRAFVLQYLRQPAESLADLLDQWTRYMEDSSA